MGKKRYESRRMARRHRRAQRPWIMIGLGGALLVGMAFLLLREGQDSQPRAAIEVHGAASLRADQQLVDLGNVKLGQTVQVSFRLTNVGDQPLRFSEKPFIEVVEGC